MKIRKKAALVFAWLLAILLMQYGTCSRTVKKGGDDPPKGEIAITIDDVPRSATRLFTADERTRKLIENLKKAGVPDVLFFVRTSSINEESRKRVDAYIEAGYHIANHSHSHYWARKVDVGTYLADIEKAHDILSPLPGVLPFYRYPFLDEGGSRESRDKIRTFLTELGLKNGYVTVDNYDWHMDLLVQQAVERGQRVDFEALKKVYVESLWKSIVFYDTIAREVLGRSPKHVLLLHENDTVALFIADLVAHVRSRGWKIIAPQEAYQDPISRIVPDVLFNGQGRVAAIARSRGYEKNRLVHESEDTGYLERLFIRRRVFD